MQSFIKSLSSLVFFILFTTSPRRAKLGGVTRGMRSAGTGTPRPSAERRTPPMAYGVLDGAPPVLGVSASPKC
jgi:hypothetical protein